MIVKRVVIGLAFAMMFSTVHAVVVHAIESGLDVGAAYYNWKEHTACGTVDETGPIGTIGGYVSGVPDSRAPALRLRTDLEYFLGRVPYDTFYGSCTAFKTNTDYWGVKLEGNFGWRITFGKSYVEPFLGLAFRTWKRDIQSGAAQGYPEYYRTFYGRIGVRTYFNLPSGVTINSALSLDPMRAAREKVDWRGVPGPDDFLNFRNGRRLGWTIEGGMAWGKLEASAYWQATHLGKSNEVSCTVVVNGVPVPASCWQPDSFQDIIGIKLGYLF